MQERFTRNWAYISSHSLIDWAENFLLDLRKSRKNPDSLYVTYGFGVNTKIVQMDRSFEKLAVDEVVNGFSKSQNLRVFLLDNEGTLQSNVLAKGTGPVAPIDVGPLAYCSPHTDPRGLRSHGTAPSDKVLKYLRTLCEDPRNIVIITSG